MLLDVALNYNEGGVGELSDGCSARKVRRLIADSGIE